LVPFARTPRGGWLLEIGCGSGVAALAAARSGTRTVGTDRNPHALRRLADIARRERLPLYLVRGDLAQGVRRFDRILANPPYLPTDERERDSDYWTNLALDGGLDGCAVTERILEQLPDHLAPGGAAYLLVSSLQSPTRLGALRAQWVRRHGPVAVVDERQLEGERLEVWRLRRRGPRPRAASRAAGRTGRSTPGTAPRRSGPRGRPSGSSRVADR
jgi:HemK-related putative methylase